MCNFNKQNEDTKALLHLLMKKCSECVGGVNFLLGIIEELRKQKPNPLISSKCSVESDNLTIKWNKVVFKDKLVVLEEVLLQHRSSEGIEFNILEADSQKKKKKILNMVKTLSPIEFLVKPKNKDEGIGFNFKVFEIKKDDYVKINPIFMTMFFCSVDFTKQALKYKV